MVRVALSILNGQDPRALRRFAEEMKKSKVDVELDAASHAAENARAARQQKWLRDRGK